MHGLESGPGGSKARYLRKHFACIAEDMSMSAVNPLKANSPARWLLPYLVLAAAVVVGMPTAGQRTVAAGLAAALVVPFLRWRLRESLSACVSVQQQVLANFRPDVVVASSWGGVVALRCLELGFFAGPAVLLAPAVSVNGWFGLFWPAVRCLRVPRSAATRVRVLQGDEDATVPKEAVLERCSAVGIEVEIVPGGDHRLNEKLLATDRLRHLVLEQWARHHHHQKEGDGR